MNLILVATEEDRILGIAASESAGVDEAEVGALYVDSARQRTGIGRALLEAVQEH